MNMPILSRHQTMQDESHQNDYHFLSYDGLLIWFPELYLFVRYFSINVTETKSNLTL